MTLNTELIKLELNQFYLSMCFTWFRIRFYVGWMLAKAMCITMALGAYPFESEPKPGVGPTKLVETGGNLKLYPHDQSFTHR